MYTKITNHVYAEMVKDLMPPIEEVENPDVKLDDLFSHLNLDSLEETDKKRAYNYRIRDQYQQKFINELLVTAGKNRYGCYPFQEPTIVRETWSWGFGKTTVLLEIAFKFLVYGVKEDIVFFTRTYLVRREMVEKMKSKMDNHNLKPLSVTSDRIVYKTKIGSTNTIRFASGEDSLRGLSPTILLMDDVPISNEFYKIFQMGFMIIIQLSGF